jgi:hypothetical protein
MRRGKRRRRLGGSFTVIRLSALSFSKLGLVPGPDITETGDRR